eukprot:gnl/TRDRNA2_/TRDRNA2_191922_c0_seq1.p1 gnl/TRDRNA2_/TRDRNA2_191922_c0~~gnl/TRDRNA2_/TRDRNA2_191922_c0_seq1.p1  ORF type:complete len:291 (-),score=28.67 gnl/TRDRNA2_/TRDRNA2_191922_c0_seq1:169-1041(-)
MLRQCWIFLALALFCQVQGRRIHARVALKESNTKEKRPACAIPYGMRKVSVLGGAFEMVILNGYDIVSQHLARDGWWEIKDPVDMYSLAGVEHSFHKNSTFLDIGANIGYYSLLFAHKGWNVIAIEPMVNNRRAFEASLCLNPHLRDRITIIPIALGSPHDANSSRCVIQSQDHNIGDGVLTCGKWVDGCNHRDPFCDEVPVKTLDMTLKDFKPAAVDVVKMDIEGHECDVFRGGTSLFTNHRPGLLQVETRWSSSKYCVQTCAHQYGYKVTAVHNGQDAMMIDKRWKLI